jgi:hypothetical protein
VITALFAAKIEATRRGVPAPERQAAIRALIEERRAAMRALAERKQSTLRAIRERRNAERHSDRQAKLPSGPDDVRPR